MNNFTYYLVIFLYLTNFVSADGRRKQRSRKSSRYRAMLLRKNFGKQPTANQNIKSAEEKSALVPSTMSSQSAPSTESLKVTAVSTTPTATAASTDTSTATAAATSALSSPTISDSGSTVTPSSDSGNSSNSGGDGKTLTKEQFQKCVAAYAESGNGTPPAPPNEVYEAYKKHVVGEMPTFEEQAMFLANSIWETGGLQFVEEIACKTGSCEYGKYFGRGYIQLTWDYNYKAASQDLFKDNRLVDKPESVATPELAWQTAVWFWKKNVRAKVSDATIKSGDLGATVKVINGALECAGSANDKAKKRLKIYNDIRKVMGLSGDGNLNGCK